MNAVVQARSIRRKSFSRLMWTRAAAMTPCGSSDWPTESYGRRGRRRTRTRMRRKVLIQQPSEIFALSSVAALLLLAHIVMPVAWAFSCPNECSGKGTCGAISSGALTLDGSAGLCSCFVGYTGPDCSRRTCPTGRAMWGAATADSTAHRSDVECSGAGTCDTSTGKCVCFSSGTSLDSERLYEGASKTRTTCLVLVVLLLLLLFVVVVASSSRCPNSFSSPAGITTHQPWQ
jgi:hypothetical protein